MREGLVSVWYGDTHGRPSYVRHEREPHYAASTMKLPLVMAAHRLDSQGRLDLDTEVEVHNEFRSAADQSRFSLDRDDDQDDAIWDLVGSKATLRRLAEHAIVRSGNLATNLLLEHVGTDAVAEVMEQAGCSGRTVLSRGIEDAAARAAGLDNTVTAHDLARLMRGIAERTLVDEDSCVAVEQLLARQEHRDKIPAGLPPGTYVANKTGWVDGVAHDVALVRPSGAAPFVLVVCTTVDVPAERANALIADVARRIWEWHLG